MENETQQELLAEIARLRKELAALKNAGGKDLPAGGGLHVDEVLLRKIIETIPDLFSIVDKDFRILLSNWHGGYDYVPQHVRDSNPFCYEAYYPGTTAPCPQCHVSEVFRTGLPVLREKQNPRIGTVEILAYPIRDDEGTIIAVSEHIRDITERKQIEETSRETEARFVSAFEYSAIGMALVAPDGCWLKVNHALCDLVGYSAEELLKRTFRDITHPDDLEGDQELKNQMLSGEIRTYQKEKRYIHKSGRLVWALLSVSLVSRHDGEPRYFIAQIQDISERKLFETQITESRAMFQTVVDGTPDWIFIKDAHYRYLLVNRAFAESQGLVPGDMIGRPDTDFFPEELCFGHLGKGIRGFHADDDEVLKGRTIHNPYNPGTLKDGSVRVFDTYKLPLRDIDGNVYGVMVYSRDITEHRQMEEQFRHAQRMEAIGLLAGGVAHDFNNIINAMQGFCSLVQMKMKSDDPSAHYLNQILALTERAGSLTRSLLAFSRKQEITVRPINLNETVSTVGKLLLKVLGEDISLNLKFSQKEIVVLADSGQIDQVIMNLATNARDAMPDGGTLTISTERVTIDDAFQKTHGCGVPGSYALLSVEDSGYGMDETIRERIFEPFFTTKEVNKGTGLGLAIVYGIIKQHNGFVTVRSEVGKGSCFQLYVPVLDMPSIDRQVMQSTPLIGGSETILLVEDDAALRRATKAILEEFGYIVLEAEDGHAAVSKMRENHDAIDFVLMDVIMPNLSGPEAYREIQKIKPEVRVLFTSGYTGDTLARRILDEGLIVLPKPVAPPELLRKIREMLDNR